MRHCGEGPWWGAWLGTLLISLGCGTQPSQKANPAPASDGSTASTSQSLNRPSLFAELATPANKKINGSEATTAKRPLVRFSNRASDLGLHFTYVNGARGEQLMVEATGGGAGWLDFDRDGWPDLYLGQGGEPWRPAAPDQPRDEFYRNIDGERFVTITELAGFDERGYGQGVCVGDFDNDGFDDLLVTNVGLSRLYCNAGDGTFQDITSQSGLREDRWSTSAAWGDVDLDGDLDLYVCRYCIYDPTHPRPCLDKAGRPSICHPQQVDPEPDEFYVNLGDGRFRPAARELGLFGEGNRGLGVVIADFNNDRWPDIFVANDTTPNFIFMNHEGKHFTEEAAVLGCAVNAEGTPQANMGIACADYDRNGFLDLYVTHFSNEWNTLYANGGPAGFSDRTALVGLVTPTLPMLAFGTTMNDFNGDGWLEIFVANGHINERRSEGSSYAQRPQLFAYNGRTWDDIAQTAGADFQQLIVGRGVAVADYDRDGKTDFVCVPQNSPTKLLHNDSEGLRVLQIDCVGRVSNRQAVGARATVIAGEIRQMAEVFGGGSYCSSQELTLTFGLGDGVLSVDIEFLWPSGQKQLLQNVSVPQRLRLIEPADSATSPEPRRTVSHGR